MVKEPWRRPRNLTVDSLLDWFASGFEPPVAARPPAWSELLPLSWHPARAGERQCAWVAGYLREHHDLGDPDPLGQIHDLVRDREGRDLACLLLGPASWNVAMRDAFIGGSDAPRRNGLGHLANNCLALSKSRSKESDARIFPTTRH